MKIPLSWLREFVDISVPVKELAGRITMAGAEVGDVERIGGGWENCCVGHVLKVEKHPNADRLTLCTVDLGGQQMRVVCGAPNVAEGQRIAFAKVGARLFDTHSGAVETLKAARIRGVASEGMICSEKELGLGEDHTGILVLPSDAPVGAPLADYLGDTVLDLEVTANRPDWLSVLGIAYEVAALTGSHVRIPDLSYPEEGALIHDQVTIEVPDPDLCPRYTASLITGVTIGPSPRWMRQRLERAGQRPINNVVDITNYVMLEYGQPLHSFDCHALKGRKIIVRQARYGETLVTLDGQERRLAPPMLVIADETDAVGLAGVMGGGNSEVSEKTTAILLESASFDPFNNRRTAASLRLRTEASARFERGLRPELPPIALRRATQLILQLAGGKVAQSIWDIYPGRKEPPALTLTLARVRKVLGITFPMEQVETVLTSLGFRCQQEGPEAIRAWTPFWRSDITIEDDLVEEVARITGYDKVPTTMLSTPIPHQQPQPLQELKEQVRDLLASCGMQEVVTYPLLGQDDLAKAEALSNGPAPIQVANPPSPQHQFLRTSLRPGLLRTLASNRRHEEGPIRIFEVGRVYLSRERDLPHERESAAGLLHGPLTGLVWLGQKGELGFSDAKGVVEAMLGELGVAASFEPMDDSFFYPGRAARVRQGGQDLGVVGEVSPSVVSRFDVERGAAAYFELDLETLAVALPTAARRYQPLPRYPGAERDIALVVDVDTPAARVQELIARHPLVTKVSLFDVYAGEQVASGKCSLAYRILFQSPQRTLTAEEVGMALEELIAALQREVGATLRGNWHAPP